ncbi:hypothetical protein DSCO28_42260 [Desulfosarcina ovata subsp. sediminis]|uniref:Permease n=1 Tax=Desulfosarcina ovata subsp. sediminis TaxID=885957 RepID=A0A5K7ZTY7_9BACT|nr:permease [Desulfosarcina ovata]BBO83660.1 hypothetical protein DSCO28_42260 [Desulfosarcina ovata subsp. sediminis]
MKPAIVFSHQETKHPIQAQRIDILSALFLVCAIFFLPAGTDSDSLNSLAIVFISIVLEAIPFMFLGALIGGFIEAFVSRERLTAMLPQKGWRTVCVAAAAGILFPVCECAVVPVVRRLIGKGLPLSAAIGYLLAGPIVNPVVAASTALAYAFNWRVVALRLVLGYTIAVIIGLAMGRIFNATTALTNPALRMADAPLPCGCMHSPVEIDPSDPHLVTPSGSFGRMDLTMVQEHGCGCSPAEAEENDWMGKMGSAFCHAQADFLAVGHYLVIGAFVAALAQTYIQRSAFLTITGVPFLAVGLMMVLAVLLNLCSEADAFIAASLQGFMPLSAQMAFMLTGPMFDLKLLLMYGGIFRRRAIVSLAVLILLVVFGVSVGLEGIGGGRP